MVLGEVREAYIADVLRALIVPSNGWFEPSIALVW